MERITVTGEFRTEGSRQKTEGRKQMLRGYSFSSFHSVAEKGFTLLELMIVISIIIILAAITLPQYQKTIKQTREAVLRDDLYKMRQLIDQYGADKGRLPQTLDDLVTEGYLREIPIDPFTGQRDWRPATGDDPNSSEGTQGLIDIHSNSEETSSEGTPYSEW